jgi:hypothetical protein
VSAANGFASLTPADLAAFAALGIPPELLKQARITRVTHAQARDEWGIKRAYGDVAGVIFPYHDVTGERRLTARLRRDHPEIENGKPAAKYVAAWGDRRSLYFVPGTHGLLADASVPVVFVEAEKSALALTAWAQRTGRSIVAIALGGCWGWRGRVGKVEAPDGGLVDQVGPLRDLNIARDGRRAFVLFDTNVATNSKVQAARAALAQQLRKQRAEVRVLELPVIDGVNGPDDFIAAKGDAAMCEVFDAAEGGAALLDEIEKFVRRFVVATQAEIVLIALWVLHTHMIDAARSTPYLSITSAEKESGKSRLLEVMELLVHKPWMTGRVTAACLTRKIDAVRPTLLLDESDAAFAGAEEYAEALRGVLNTGYRWNGVASCCVGQGANIGFHDFKTFCPKAIAGIGKLPDTVASRSIAIWLKRRAPGEAVEDFDSEDRKSVV